MEFKKIGVLFKNCIKRLRKIDFNFFHFYHFLDVMVHKKGAQKNDISNKNVNLYDKKDKPSVSNWLNAIKTCKFLITDSFHGVCFAIIFNKPFVCIKNQDRGGARFDTLCELFLLLR